MPDIKSQHSAAVTAMSLAETDPDMELVRKLHLELNGSGRRARGGVPPPSKRYKRDTSRGLSEGGGSLQVLHQGRGALKLFLMQAQLLLFPIGPKDTPSASRSGSGSGSARLLRREGALRRLVKKQPESDSNQHNGLGGCNLPVPTMTQKSNPSLYS